MANFRGGNRSGGGRGFERRPFNDRSSRGPVQMHQATCDNCKQSCEVPFRPTSGKPVFCSNCFGNNRDSDSRPSSRPSFDDRQMFDATCDECRNSCKVPFRPSGDKPVYCSNCFGEKKGAGDRNNGASQFQHKELFESLNTKLDKILALLTPDTFAQAAHEELVIEDPQIEEVVVNTEEKVRAPKKKTSKK